MKKNILLCCLSTIVGFCSFGQGFTPEDPDTAYLSRLVNASSSQLSLAQLYLQKYYPSTSGLDSVSYYEWSDTSICYFVKKYAKGTAYKLDVCSEEGGGNEILYFPKMETKAAKVFIEKLFFDPENTWQNELSYAPDGVGCYYEIRQTSIRTMVHIYCGC